jgi:hypothetical protein
MSANKGSTSHATFLRIYRWVEAHKGYIQTKPHKKVLIAKASKDLGIEVSKFTLENCLKEAGIWYVDARNMGKPGGPKISHYSLADIILRFNSALKREFGLEILHEDEISRLQSVRDKISSNGE